MAKLLLKRYLEEDAQEDVEPGPFGASCDDDQQRDQQLAQFDCSLRLYEFTEEKKVWMTAARNVALQIRSGAMGHILWWSPKVDSPVEPLQHARLDVSTGVHEFQVDAACCTALFHYLERSFSPNHKESSEP